MTDFHYDPEREIDVDPTVDSVCLPFLLVDSDRDQVHRLVSVPVVMPPDWLAATLFLAAEPRELACGEPAVVWATCAEFLLLAGVEHLASRLDEVQTAANTDPDAFLRWTRCRDLVRDLFTGPADPGPGLRSVS